MTLSQGTSEPHVVPKKERTGARHGVGIPEWPKDDIIYLHGSHEDYHADLKALGGSAASPGFSSSASALGSLYRVQHLGVWALWVYACLS